MSDDSQQADPGAPKLTRTGEMPFSVADRKVAVREDEAVDVLAWDTEDGAMQDKRSWFTWRWLLVYAIGLWVLLYFVERRLTVEGEVLIPEVAAEDLIEVGPPVFDRPPREVAEAFVQALDSQERLQWVRNAERVRGHLAGYSHQALEEPVVELRDLGMVSNGREVVAGFGAIFADGSKRLVSVVPTDEGPRVDWDCYARYCSAAWEDILAGKVGAADIRVYAKPCDYYNYTYRDEARWDVYEMSSPDLDVVVYGYVAKGSREARILKSMVPEQTGDGLRMTLRVALGKDDGQRRQLKIERVLAYSWVRGAEDLQDRWVDPSEER